MPDHALVLTGVPAPVLAICVAAGSVWLGGAGGVVKFTPGQQPGELQAPPFDGPVTAMHPSSGCLVVGGAVGIALLSSSGWSPAEVQGGRSPVAALASLVHEEQDVLLAATIGDGVLRSEDGGRSWIGSSFGLTDREATCLAVNPPTGTVLAGTSAGLFRSTKAGRAWRHCTAIRDAVAAATYGQDGVAVVVLEHGTVLRSTDDGDTWVRAGEVPHAPSAVVATTTGSLLVATMSEGLWQSDGRGSTFRRVADDVQVVHGLAAGPNRLYLGTDTGPMASDDGLRWVPFYQERATC